MNRNICGALLLALIAPMPLYATVIVSSPTSRETVTSPFTLSANASVCSAQPVAAMGYSFDSMTDTTIIDATSIKTSVASGAGAHVLHVKAWGNQGASCVTDVSLTVIESASASIIPSNAESVSSLESMNSWIAVKDSSSGTGTASGTTSIVTTPAMNGHARRFLTKYQSGGGERYSVVFGDDESATHFFYDGWVYLDSSSAQIGNLELDMNQTMANGETVIYGFQCDGYTSTWDYTRNAGTVKAPSDQWVHSRASCNPRNWTRNVWHHVQIYFFRDATGMVTYQTVWLDGVEQTINGKVPSAFALGWGPVLLTNFQVDGLGASGAPVAYLDNLTVSRW